jgi:hypothetical protein
MDARSVMTLQQWRGSWRLFAPEGAPVLVFVNGAKFKEFVIPAGIPSISFLTSWSGLDPGLRRDDRQFDFVAS